MTLVFAAVLLGALPAHADPASACVDDPMSPIKLQMGVRPDPEAVPVSYETAVAQLLATHAQYDYFMWQKHLLGYFYSHKPVPKGELSPVHVTQSQIDDYFARIDPGERPAAILAYWKGHSSSGREPLCVGLIRAEHQILVERSHLELDWSTNEVVSALGVRSLQASRRPRERGVEPIGRADEGPHLSAEEALARASRGLLPGSIATVLAAGEVRSLLVLPIEELGSVPFAALPVGMPTQPLIELTSIVVAPALYALRDVASRRVEPHGFHNALIVGDPDLSWDKQWIFPPLDGARSEAAAVAGLVGGKARLGAEAESASVLKALHGKKPLDLIYLATHAVSDQKDPLDRSFVALSGGHLFTRDIQKLRLRGHPLVVLSACQTGLGKGLDGGIFGMAFAWWSSGARYVVMSLWNVDDQATERLMTDFMRRTSAGLPAPRALAEAMRSLRGNLPNPALWAAFSVYGLSPFGGAE